MDKYQRFFEGYEDRAFELFGCHKKDKQITFTLYAPNAYKVEVFGSFNDWRHFIKMEKIDNRGIFYAAITGLEFIYSYKYRIYKDENTFQDKIDPYGYYFEYRPSNASCMYDLNYYKFSDEQYLKNNKFSIENPLNIYEVHLNGFKKETEVSSYQELKKTLIPYVKSMGYTHIEIMPLFEHPFDGSWGYQASGFFACTSRYGTIYDFMDFVNEAHLNGIGVILDVVYSHFVNDDFSLINYDYSNLYEYNDEDRQKSEWGSYYFDLGKGHVNSFLISSANFFLEKYHLDGLRFDAVSHFIYIQGNSEKGLNQEGLSFIKRMNYTLKENHQNCILIAEDSSAYPGVTKKTSDNGLGFDFKWDLGWMNDTLKYYSLDPIYREYHHNLINFSMHYFYNENFLLPFSHDEVVHSKLTIVDKMFGDIEEKFRHLRNLYVYMYTHPGKKLNFMGNEIAMFREFDERKEMDWFILKFPLHDSFKRFVLDLNRIYLYYQAFSRLDYNSSSFKWIDADNNKQCIYSYIREDEEYCFVVILNMLKVSYEEYTIGVPYFGEYQELINSDRDIYSGYNMCNYTNLISSLKESHGFKYSLKIRLAPYAGIIFKHRKTSV